MSTCFSDYFNSCWFGFRPGVTQFAISPIIVSVYPFIFTHFYRFICKSLLNNTYSNNGDIQQIPEVGEIFYEPEGKQLEEKFESEYDGEKVVAEYQESLQILLFFEIDVFEYLEENPDMLYLSSCAILYESVWKLLLSRNVQNDLQMGKNFHF